MIFLRCEAGLYKLCCFPWSHTCPPPKNVRSRDLELNKDKPLPTRLCFWLKRGPSTASSPAWWMLGGGFATFGIKYHRRSSRSWFHVVAALPSSFWVMQATELLRLRRDKSARHARLLPRVISRLHFSLTFLTKVKWFSNVFCAVGIAIVVQKSHCPLILC